METFTVVFSRKYEPRTRPTLDAAFQVAARAHVKGDAISKIYDSAGQLVAVYDMCFGARQLDKMSAKARDQHVAHIERSW